jgi:hypothetical protein
MAMTFGMITYTQLVQRNLFMAETTLVEDYNASQAKNISQSIAKLAIAKVKDPGDDEFSPSKNSTIKVPSNGFQEWNLMEGSYSLELENLGDTVLVITATGKVDEETYTHNIRLRKLDPIWNPEMPWAVFAGSSIDLSGSARLEGDGGTNATNAGAVQLDWSTRITGSLLIGPGGIPLTTVSQGNIISGNVDGGISTLSQEMSYELPKFIEYPAKTNVRPTITLDWQNNGMVLSPGDYDGSFINQINIPSNYTLNIDTGGEDRILHVNELNITQGHLNVTGEGKLTIIAENKLILNGSSTLNSTVSADEGTEVFTYYGGSDKLSFGGATEFNSDIYAKDAEIEITGSGGIQGHIITGGNKLTISGAADAVTRALFAPNADVVMTGSGKLTGSIVAKTFTASGAALVDFSNEFDETIPVLVSQENTGYKIAYWY